ncbi:MAG: hypothetical protein V1770_04640 [bacterium]
MVRKSFLLVVVIFTATLFSCIQVYAWSTGDYWLNFNPYAYTTEYFQKNGTVYGNCGGAALVIVEAHCRLKSSIASNTVTLKTDEMIKNFGNPLNGIYYEFSVMNIMNQLKVDGYNVANRTTTTESGAKDVILDVLSKKHWLVVLCRYNFNLTSLGHYVPIYGARWTGDVNTSTVNAIESCNSAYFYNPQRPNWNVMYRTGINMATLLQSMRSASSKYYNLIEVW